MKTARELVSDFEAEVRKIVTASWPKIVAEQTLLVAERFKAPTFKDSRAYVNAYNKYGSKAAAARALGIPETTFRERLAKAGG